MTPSDALNLKILLRKNVLLSRGRADRLPLYVGAEDLMRANLTMIAQGGKPPVREIGALTHEQFVEVNKVRVSLGLHEVRENGIVFLGRHLFTSRSKDGYTIEDMLLQIASAMDSRATVMVHPGMTALQNTTARQDRLGNAIKDRAIFEATVRKPRLELYSVIPKGDAIKPCNVIKEIEEATSQ